MTPAVLTLSGRWVDCPPYTLRPTTRFAYWTGMRRCERSMNITKKMTAIINTRIKSSSQKPAIARRTR